MPQNARLTISTVDSYDRRAAIPFLVLIDDAQTAADMAAEAALLATLLDALTGSRIVAVDFGVYLFGAGAWKGAPADGSDARMAWLLAFKPGMYTPRWALVIPAMLPSKLSGGTLNEDDTDVAALLAHLLTPPDGYTFVDPAGRSLLQFAWSRMAVRKFGRARRK